MISAASTAPDYRRRRPAPQPALNLGRGRCGCKEFLEWQGLPSAVDKVIAMAMTRCDIAVKCRDLASQLKGGDGVAGDDNRFAPR
jgi:hypothetical protein